VQNKSCSSRHDEKGIGNRQVVEPESTARLQPGYWQFSHRSQKYERSVTGNHLCHWHKTLPHLDARPPMDCLNFRPDLKNCGRVPSNRRHLFRKGLRDRLDGLHPGCVIRRIDVGLE